MCFIAAILYVNLFPTNAERACHQERYMMLRGAVPSLLFLPLFLPAIILADDSIGANAYPALLKSLVGGLYIVPLLPILAWRYLAQLEMDMRVREDFFGGQD